MTQTNGKGPVVEVKPEPDVYSVLTLVSVLALALTLGLCLYRLLQPVESGGYGLEFGQLFDGTLPDKLP